MENNKRLSVLIPAYNEEKTIGILMDKVATVKFHGGMELEMVVVDDCSTDTTAEEIKAFADRHPDIKLVHKKHEKNGGKGRAIRTAIENATGDIMVVQDADLEYDPNDFNLMLPFMLNDDFQVVYGSRFLNCKNRHSYTSFYLGGRLISLTTNILYWQHLTDEPTCYKMFTKEVAQKIKLRCTGFEFCPEFTAKAIKAGYQIIEVPIHYYPRSLDEGKKIRWYDGVEAIWTLLKYRFIK